MNNEIRKLQKIKRKSFLPTLIITLLLWAITISVIIFVDPDTGLAIPLFLFMVFSALFFTFSILLVNRRRGFILSLGISIYLLFKILGVGTILNLILLIGILTAVEVYFSKKQ